jgi:AcrR family transcriptional regulator
VLFAASVDSENNADYGPYTAILTQMDRSPVITPGKLFAVEGKVAQRGLPMLEPVRHERADAARNRATILVAAEALVAEHGAQCVTMDQVARAAGVGKGTLFRHFGDRCGLMRALLDERERSFQEGFIRGAPPLGPGAPPLERLVAFGERMLEHIEIQGDLLAAAEGPPGERLRHSVYAAYRAHVAVLLEQSGYAGDIGYLADVLLGALTAELVLFQRREMAIPPDRLKAGWAGLIASLLGSS